MVTIFALKKPAANLPFRAKIHVQMEQYLVKFFMQK